MKVSVYIEDGDMQFVLNPETSWERALLRATPAVVQFGATEAEPVWTAKIYRGSFSERQSGYYLHDTGESRGLIIRMLQPVAPDEHADAPLSDSHLR